MIIATNRGEPLVLKKKLTLAGIAYENAARRLVRGGGGKGLGWWIGCGRGARALASMVQWRLPYAGGIFCLPGARLGRRGCGPPRHHPSLADAPAPGCCTRTRVLRRGRRIS